MVRGASSKLIKRRRGKTQDDAKKVSIFIAFFGVMNILIHFLFANCSWISWRAWNGATVWERAMAWSRGSLSRSNGMEGSDGVEPRSDRDVSIADLIFDCIYHMNI